MPVTAWLPKHQDKFDVVFDNGIRLVWFSKERSTIPSDLSRNVCNFVPDDRCQWIESDLLTLHLQI